MASRVEKIPSRIRIRSFSLIHVVDGNNGVLNTRCWWTWISSLKRTVGRCWMTIFRFFKGPLLRGEDIDLFFVEGVAVVPVISSPILWFMVVVSIAFRERSWCSEIELIEIMAKELNFTATGGWCRPALKLFGELWSEFPGSPNGLRYPHNCVCIRGETDRMWRIKVWNRETNCVRNSI